MSMTTDAFMFVSYTLMNRTLTYEPIALFSTHERIIVMTVNVDKRMKVQCDSQKIIKMKLFVFILRK